MRFRSLLSLILALMLVSAALPCAGEAAGCMVKEVPVWNEDTSIPLRFFDDVPDVPYLGIRYYLSLMYDVELPVPVREGETWRLDHPGGFSLLADPSAGTLVSEDWARFQAPLLPYSRMPMGLHDSSCAYIRVEEIVYDDPPAPVTFDLGKYGIRLYADAEDVYLPLAVVSTLFADIATNFLVWNGEQAFRAILGRGTSSDWASAFFGSEALTAAFTGASPLSESISLESYRELCFIFDYLYGWPGRAQLEAALTEGGLDTAIGSLEDGETLRASLQSGDLVDFTIAFNRLFLNGLDDGHTSVSVANSLLGENPPYPDITTPIQQELTPLAIHALTTHLQIMMYVIRPEREAEWGTESYRECGSTAIIRIDSFMPDEEGWQAYYAGEGDVPDDSYGTVWKGLRRASENPAIKNILFDLTANTGGSSDALMAILGLATGQDVLWGYNTLTRQKVYGVFRVDKNLDGAFDEQDDRIRYDFRYAVLTTGASFSAGNLFPALMKEQGAVLIGEPTGGGSCCVQPGTLSNGVWFCLSSHLWRLWAEEAETLEHGTPVDIPIELKPLSLTLIDGTVVEVGDYIDYFSDQALNQMINEWFDAQEQEIPAA